jgi:hypothetical protein
MSVATFDDVVIDPNDGEAEEEDEEVNEGDAVHDVAPLLSSPVDLLVVAARVTAKSKQQSVFSPENCALDCFWWSSK